MTFYITSIIKNINRNDVQLHYFISCMIKFFFLGKEVYQIDTITEWNRPCFPQKSKNQKIKLKNTW